MKLKIQRIRRFHKKIRHFFNKIKNEREKKEREEMISVLKKIEIDKRMDKRRKKETFFPSYRLQELPLE